MAVIQATIKSELLALYASAESGEGIDGAAFADTLATIIRNAIISGDVQFPIAVTVDGGTHQGGTTAKGTIL